LTRPGEYRMADEAYAKLAVKLAEKDFVEAEVSENVLAFFQDLSLPYATKRDAGKWRGKGGALLENSGPRRGGGGGGGGPSGGGARGEVSGEPAPLGWGLRTRPQRGLMLRWLLVRSRAPCNGRPQPPPGPEGSNGSGVVRVPRITRGLALLPATCIRS